MSETDKKKKSGAWSNSGGLRKINRNIGKEKRDRRRENYNSKQESRFKFGQGVISNSDTDFKSYEEEQKESDMQKYRKKRGIDNEFQRDLLGQFADPVSRKKKLDELRPKPEDRPLRHLCFHYKPVDIDGEIQMRCKFLSSDPSECLVICSNWKSFKPDLIKKKLGSRLRTKSSVITWFDIMDVDSIESDHQYAVSLDVFQEAI